MKNNPYLLITLLGTVLFIPFLGQANLFDWDEINFAESAREMLLTGNYTQVQINFQPFIEKPPLFIWLQALCMKIFGVNEFAARLPNALTGIATLLVLFNIGSKVKDERFGALWVLAYIGTFLPHFYFKSGIIDPLFNLFIFLGIWQFVRLTWLLPDSNIHRNKAAIYAGLFIGLAILTKGPVALLLSVITAFIFWALNRFKILVKFKEVVLFFVVAAIVSTAWFGFETIRNGPYFLVEFIQYQIELFSEPVAGHSGPFFYHFLVLFFGCFPASILLFGALGSSADEPYPIRHTKKWMIILLLVVLIIFSIVKTKIVHYSSLTYFPITFLAAYFLYKLLYLRDKQLGPLYSAGLLSLGLLWVSAILLIPVIGLNTELLQLNSKDPFAEAALTANVDWHVWDVLPGFAYGIALVISIIWLNRKSTRIRGAVLLFAATAVSLQLIMLHFVPKIEAYSQRAAIDFYREKAKENAIVEVLGFKSYAHLFYTNKQMPEDKRWLEKDYLLQNNIGKPVYFVAKINNAERIAEENNLQIIGSKNGFVFMVKKNL